MSTTVHIPPKILSAVDKKAEKLKISRNNLIVKALEKEIASEWPESFLNKTLIANKELDEAVNDMMKVIKSGRVNKKGNVKL